jgi:V/A-type H+-transporting ATPase subunit D
MAETAHIAATRMNLLRAQKRLQRVVKGIDLLQRKREALAAELFGLVKPAVDARKLITDHTTRAYPPLLRALALHSQAGIRAMAWPARDLEVEIIPSTVWGIAASDIVSRPPLSRTLGARGTAPGSTGPAASEAAAQFEVLASLLLDAAPREMLIRRLGEALARTSRQLNTLDQRVAPALRAQIATVQRTLEEREREEHLRLKHLLNKRKAGFKGAPSPE